MLWRPSGLIQPARTGRRVSWGASGAWTPASLGAALVGWWDATTGVYSDAGSTLANNNDIVQQWNDQSGNGVNLSQGTSGSRPTYLTSGFNSSYKTIKFPNSSGAFWLESASNALTYGASCTTISTFVVCQLVSTTSQFGRVISYLGNGATLDYLDVLAYAFGQHSSNSDISVHRTTPNIIVDTRTAVSTNYRLGIIFDGANATFYVDNSAGTPAGNTGTFASTGTFRVAARDSGTDPFDILVSEVVTTKTALSLADRNSLDAYFTTKWGL
jgi:hypothetical protein